MTDEQREASSENTAAPQGRYEMPLAVIVELVAQAVAKFEGYWNPIGKQGPNPSQRNKNPGNLRSWGTTPVVGGYAQFATTADGWRALRLQCWKNIVGRRLTLWEFFGGEGRYGGYAGYAPVADGNHTMQYVMFVRDWLQDRGVPIESKDDVLAAFASDWKHTDQRSKYPGLYDVA